MDHIGTSRAITRAAATLAALGPVLPELNTAGAHVAARDAAIERGWFTPAEEDVVRAWFARYLTARSALLEVIDELRAAAKAEMEQTPRRPEAFIVAYAAACMLVCSARTLVGGYANHKIIQRKLNEPAPAHRIPRKQYTKVYRSMTHPVNAWRLFEAMRWADDHRAALRAAAASPPLDAVWPHLEASEQSVRVDAAAWLKARLRYRWHAWRRRRASVTQRAAFALLEAGGRTVADIRAPWHRPRVTAAIRDELAGLLAPGDVIITRHDDAMSNLFLPGYWPHSALHVGTADAARALSVRIDDARAARWCGDIRVLEARKDGVLFRVLPDTLHVDAVTVLRPRLPAEHIAEALGRAITHEGKLYNFDFDFFRSDRLVCTEVIYRSFDGVGGMRLPLTQRAGRPTLSAEDLIRMALAREQFEPLAVFGPPGATEAVRTGADAERILRETCVETATET